MDVQAQIGELSGSIVTKLDLSLERSTFAMHVTITEAGGERKVVCLFTGVRRLSIEHQVGEDWDYTDLTEVNATPRRKGGGYSVLVSFWSDVTIMRLECADLVVTPWTGAP